MLRKQVEKVLAAGVTLEGVIWLVMPHRRAAVRPVRHCPSSSLCSSQHLDSFPLPSLWGLLAGNMSLRRQRCPGQMSNGTRTSYPSTLAHHIPGCLWQSAIIFPSTHLAHEAPLSFHLSFQVACIVFLSSPSSFK